MGGELAKNHGPGLTKVQDLRLGDLVRLAPERFGPEAGLRVVGPDPLRTLLLHQPTDPGTRRPMDRGSPNQGAYFGWNWAFVLEGSDGGSTRLIVRSRVDGRPRVLVEIPHFVMERGMLRGIERRAERSRRS